MTRRLGVHAAGRRPDAGVTLVEVLVALVLFALIGGAGFGMLDQILRTQAVTEGRLERLAVIQRSMYLMTTDFAQARSTSLVADTGADGSQVTISRNAAETGAGWIRLTYRTTNDVLVREVIDASGRPVTVQPLMAEVLGVEWQFLDPDGAWLDQWPPPRQVAVLQRAEPNPSAIAATIRLRDGRELRRVAALPAEPR